MEVEESNRVFVKSKPCLRADLMASTFFFFAS